MDSPQISRSGRLLKKSAKVKEMEDFDINELNDVPGKPRKKTKAVDDFDEYDDKHVAPIKIPKMSFNMQGGLKRKMSDMPSSSFQNSMKAKQEARRSIYHDSSNCSKESDSSSSESTSSSSSSSSSSEATDDDELFSDEYKNVKKLSLNPSLQSLSVHQDKVVEHKQQLGTSTYMEPSSDISVNDSEDVSSDTALVIAEDSDGSSNYLSKSKKGNTKIKRGKNDPAYPPRQGNAGRKKTPAKAVNTSAKKPSPKSKPLSAYMLWCSENRKKIAASCGNIGFGNIGKKLGEAWQALPEKEKVAWRRKAKALALKAPGNVVNATSNSTPSKAPNKASLTVNEELLKGLTESSIPLGTAPIDAASHLKLLGDSLTVIGQRLIEHEGQLAVSGIYSVLLDTLLCAIGPLLCLTTQINGLEHLSQDVFKRTLDHIAYFMPGL